MSIIPSFSTSTNKPAANFFVASGSSSLTLRLSENNESHFLSEKWAVQVNNNNTGRVFTFWLDNGMKKKAKSFLKSQQSAEHSKKKKAQEHPLYDMSSYSFKK